uniref:Ribosomal_L7Ae domain-containing protein n=1 Tax=Macrostomum lignano TaxID=282301 RepID=A0A1I8JJ33_9PLAT
SKSQPQPQSVGRRQQLNRAARQSLLLSSSLLVVNKAIAAVHQRPAAGKSSGAASSGVGHSSSGAPVRVGKQRERPKAKKKSLTKKIILMERQASRRFREYCDQLLMKSVQELSVKVLRDLAFYQARARARDPAKAKQKRRLVMGLREARKHIGLNRIRLVFISPDLERVQAPGGLDDSVNQLINLCQQRSVPYVFGLKRREMGRVLRKTVPVSVVAVFDYQGCEANVNALLELVHKARADYETLSRMALECARVDDHSVAKDAIVVANEAATEVAEESVTNQQQQIRPSASHSRNPSDTSNPISEPLSELDSSAPAAAAVASAAPNSQLYGFHSRQSSLGVVVVAQAIDENESGAANDAANSSTAGDKVAKWLSNGTELGDA